MHGRKETCIYSTRSICIYIYMYRYTHTFSFIIDQSMPLKGSGRPVSRHPARQNERSMRWGRGHGFRELRRTPTIMFFENGQPGKGARHFLPCKAATGICLTTSDEKHPNRPGCGHAFCWAGRYDD